MLDLYKNPNLMKIFKLFLLVCATSLLSAQTAVSKEDQKLFESFQEEAQSGAFTNAMNTIAPLVKSYPDHYQFKYLKAYCILESSFDHLDEAVMLLEACQNNTSGDVVLGDVDNKKAPLDVHFLLSKAYYAKLDIPAAKESLEKYKTALGNNASEEVSQEIKQYEAFLAEAEVLYKAPVNVLISSVKGDVNTDWSEYSPVVTADGQEMYFTSKRPVKQENGKFEEFEDIFYTKLVDGKWITPVALDTNINTRYHEATICVSPNGDELYIYKSGNKVTEGLYVSKKVRGKWQTPEKLGSDINTPYYENHANINRDGTMLFYTSDRPGGKGGLDIYYCKRLPNGEWGLSRNAGSKINTIYDEDSPYFHFDGKTLYFSSKGHGGLGGFDIFKTELDENGEWKDPINMGFPINSTDHDIFFHPNLDGSEAFFSSAKVGGLGQQDIYLMTFPDIEKKSIQVFKGKVTDELGNILPNSTVTLTDKDGNIVGEYKTNEDGEYLLILQPGDYELTFENDDYLTRSKAITIEENKGAKLEEVTRLDDVALGQLLLVEREKEETPIEAPKKIEPVKNEIVNAPEGWTLPNVEFDFDKATIRKSSFGDLDKVVKILNDNPNVKIEIGGHTDNWGSDAYNEVLSDNRAKSVFNYLANKGINKDRMTYVGYGEKQPKVANDTKANRQINRRIEFKVVQM